jgi:hypothetical protein
LPEESPRIYNLERDIVYFAVCPRIGFTGNSAGRDQGPTRIVEGYGWAR